MNSTEIAQLFLTSFHRTNSKPNHIIDERWIRHTLMEQLNPKEQTLVNDAINELVQQGLVTTDNRNGAFCVVLTEKGFDHIYPIKENEVIEKIGSAILFQFAELKSKANHIIDKRWLHNNLMKTLNPKEQDLVNSGIDKLVERGVITTDKRNGMFCVVLTEKGFNEIY